MALRAAGPLSRAHAAYWAAYALHAAVLPTLLDRLGRPARGPHPEQPHAEASKRELARAGAAVALGADVTLTAEALATYKASPWHTDQPADDICIPRPVPSEANPAPPSIARCVSYHKLLSRMYAALEAQEAASLI